MKRHSDAVWGRLFLAFIFIGLLLLASLSVADLQFQPKPANSEIALKWLERLGPAMNMTSYRGVFVYGRDQQLHSMGVAHRFNGSIVEERLVIQDGGSGEIVRRDMEVVCVLPAQGAVTLDAIMPSRPLADSFSDQLVPAKRWYQVQMLGESRVAGYAAVKIALTSNDPYRYSYRLWLEKNTGLLVKSHTRNANEQILEHFQFTSLDITDDIADSELQITTSGQVHTSRLGPGSGIAAPELVTRLQGWSLGWLPAGFEPAATPRSDQRQVIAFSDGLAAFSVFVEDLVNLDMPTGASRIGATTVYLRPLNSEGRQVLISVVGEVPPVTARKVAESVRFDKVTANQAQHQGASR